jgi:hypothetical protein
MNAKSLMIGVVVGALLGGVAVAAASGSGWNFGRLVRARLGISAGTLEKDGMFHAKSDGTRDMFSGDTSAGSEVFTVDKNGDMTVSSVTTAGVLVDNDAVSDVPLKIEAVASQAVDAFQITAYDGSTEWVDVSSAGLLGAKKGIAIAGDVTIDGTAGLDAASIVIDGNTLTFAEGLLTACSGAGCP